MNKDIISLDFYNSHFYIKLDDIEYYSDSLSKFETDIGYPYCSIKFLAYEPARNIYQVEDSDNITKTGPETQEIGWFLDNKPHLMFVLTNLEQTNAQVFTLEIERNIRFADTDWLIQRHQEEILLMKTPTLTNTQFTNLLNYRQQLRDLTDTYSKDTVTNAVVWPTNPIN